jgi:predicted RNA-binding protein
MELNKNITYKIYCPDHRELVVDKLHDLSYYNEGVFGHFLKINGDGVDTFDVMDHEGEVHGYLSKYEVTELMFKSQGNMLNSVKKLKWTDL